MQVIGETKQREETVYKFSKKGQDQLRESAIIEGKPYFIKYFCDEEKGKKFIQVEPKITDVTPNLRPPLREEYPYNPYEFKTVDEPQKYLLASMKETPDSLLVKIKNIVKKYNDVDEKTATLLSANILGSYFQDRFSTVHYLIVVGANGTGKSAFGDTFDCIGYRPIKVSNTTDAFWFRVFGNIEYGQVTIIVEEFDRMDENGQIMTVLKEGYQPNSKVARMVNDNTKIEFFYPFGFKIMISEKSPNEDAARGVLDRSFKIKTYKGRPEFNIKEIRNPQGNPRRQQSYDEMEDLRKRLLMYRLIHIKDPYREIEIGLDGRDEELCKPLLQLFYTLGTSEETQREIERTLQHFLTIKNERKNDSFEASLYPIVVNTVSQYGVDYKSDEDSKRIRSISTTKLWEEITTTFEGNVDVTKPNVWYSVDFGKKYRNTVIRLICDKFGAEKDHKEKGNNLAFDLERLNKVGKIYENDGRIKTKPLDESAKNEHERGVTDSLTHSEYCSERVDQVTQHVVELKEDVNKTDSPCTLFHRHTQVESVNQYEVGKTNPSTFTKSLEVNLIRGKVKCAYCDYKEHPFFLKVHMTNVHGIGIEPEIREVVPKWVKTISTNENEISYEDDEVRRFINPKIRTSQAGDQITIGICPSIGNLSIQNNFLRGNLNLRGKGRNRYPYDYLDFIKDVFGYVSPGGTIEVCSNEIAGLQRCKDEGREASCYTVDINPKYKPDLVADAEALERLEESSFYRWRCNLPYNEKTTKEIYDSQLPKLLKAGARLVKPGSLMFLLCSDVQEPVPEGLKKIGIIAISIVPTKEIRVLNIYVKLADE